jgi:hypothetical protein
MHSGGFQNCTLGMCESACAGRPPQENFRHDPGLTLSLLAHLRGLVGSVPEQVGSLPSPCSGAVGVFTAG